MLLCVDDCLSISETPKESVLQLDKFFKMRLPNTVEAWTFSSSQYVQEAVSNVEKFLQDIDGSMLSMKINAILSNVYRPELYSSIGAQF